MTEEELRLQAIAEADEAEAQEQELRRDLDTQQVEHEAARSRSLDKIRAALLNHRQG